MQDSETALLSWPSVPSAADTGSSEQPRLLCHFLGRIRLPCFGVQGLKAAWAGSGELQHKPAKPPGSLKFKAPGGIDFCTRLLHKAHCMPMIRISRRPRQRVEDVFVFSSYDYPVTDAGVPFSSWLYPDQQERLYPAARCTTH